MNGPQILTLGLGLQAPWVHKDQQLKLRVAPHPMDLYLEVERGSLCPCPECGNACPAHAFTYPWLLEQGQLHRHDLPDWQPGLLPIRSGQIHMK